MGVGVPVHMKLPVGKIVKVKSDLVCGDYGGNTFTPIMKKYRGRLFYIEDNSNWNSYGYGLKGIGWKWTSQMLEFPNNEEIDIFLRREDEANC